MSKQKIFKKLEKKLLKLFNKTKILKHPKKAKNAIKYLKDFKNKT
jgi:hypothetical protein